MELLRLNIQMFADGKVVIETDLDKNGFDVSIKQKVLSLSFRNSEYLQMNVFISVTM